MKALPAEGMKSGFGGSGGMSQGKMGGSPDMASKTFKKPKTLVCYIWYHRLYYLISFSGREFGTASLEIHLKSCKKKWEDD